MEIRQAILKAADHIEANPGEFSFSSTAIPHEAGCGTPGCAIGWIAVFAGERDQGRAFGVLFSEYQMLGTSDHEFYRRMNNLSPDQSWKHSAQTCAATLRLYADKFHAVSPHERDIADSTAAHGTAEYFWSRVNIRGDNDCWLWTGSKNKVTGYGSLRFRGQSDTAHRVAYGLAKGPIPSNLLVMHSCDVRECCNPNHLSAGTHQDNADDMVAKGRATQRGERGSKNGFSKLCEADVLDIHSQIKSGVRTAEIAQQFNVSEQAIYAIRSGRNWGWLTGLDNPEIMAELDRISQRVAA